MTQFKDKSKKRKNILAGLLNYPTLMAADILLYDADLVPVGKDQSQHLEFTRTVARKFNSKFGVTFKEPRALLKKEGALIMGLDNPSNKMAKSAQSPNNYIAILDEPNEIQRKIKIAVTDSGKEIKYDPVKKPAISNLLIIYSAMSGKSIKNLESKFKEKTYAEFKSSLADLLVEKLSQAAYCPTSVCHVPNRLAIRVYLSILFIVSQNIVKYYNLTISSFHYASTDLQ